MDNWRTLKVRPEVPAAPGPRASASNGNATKTAEKPPYRRIGQPTTYGPTAAPAPARPPAAAPPPPPAPATTPARVRLSPVKEQPPAPGQLPASPPPRAPAPPPVQSPLRVAPQPAAAPTGGRRLGDLLVEEGLITTRQLEEALIQRGPSGQRLGGLLVELGLLDDRNLTKVLSRQMGVPLADLRHLKPEPAALAMLPEGVARSLTAIPVRRNGAALEVVVADPSPEVVAALERATGARVSLLLGSLSDVQRTIDTVYRSVVDIESQVAAFQATETSRAVATPLQKAVEDEAPVVKVVNLIITQALRDRASDIHIEPKDGRLRVRYRIDGALHDVVALPATMGPAVVSRLKIMAEMNIVERQRSQDGQISMVIDGRQVDIRVATTSTIWGEKAVLRLLDKSKQLFRLEDLGMSADTQSAYAKLIRMPFGMVICAGPTGSGKTTTLYATLNDVNDSERNVMTIEDPVEYVFMAANQIQIREQAGITFAGGLKAILRQDPDVILVGEIRDVETARIAVQSALTGHFVLTSLHATDSVSALQRFLDMGVESFLIASSVVGVVGQRLVRKTCQGCAAPYQPSDDELVFYAESGGPAKTEFYRGEGCNLCAHTGYQERIGVYELLQVTDEIRSMIVRGASHDELRKMAIAQGMRPLRQEAIGLVNQDITTIAEVMRSIYTL